MLSIQFVVMVAVGGLGNIYGAVAGTVAILYLEQKLRELGTRPDLFGWDLPDAAPTVVLVRCLRADPDRDHALLPARAAAGGR